MARIRTIKPEFFTSLTIAGLPIEARLTFIGLWTHVDDEGRCVDDARLIKAALWPLDDRTVIDVEGDLRALTESSLITRYVLSERSVIAVQGWTEHQRVNRPTPSKFPPPPIDAPPPPPSPLPPPPPAQTRPAAAIHGVLSDNSLRTHGGLTEGSLPERKGKEGNRELKTSALASLDAGTADLKIIEGWNAGAITRGWVDHCARNGVEMPNSIIKRYAAAIKRALDSGTPAQRIHSALGAMFEDRVVSRPALFDSYLVRMQQGPELPPRRVGKVEASVLRADDGPTSRLLREFFPRPA